MKTSEAVSHFLIHIEFVKKLSELTIKAYRQDLNLLLKIIEQDLNVSQIDKQVLANCVTRFFELEYSKASVKRRIACYKSFFNWLEDEGHLAESPFHKLRLKIKLPSRLPKNLSTTELKKMMVTAESEACGGGVKQKTLYLALEILLTTGVRISELTGIKVSDIFLQDNYIQIEGKGQRERQVFIVSDSIKKSLAQYLVIRANKNAQDSQLFINSYGKALSPQTFRLWMSELGKRSGLARKVTPHMYRHSAATQLLEAGVDIRYVQRLLGHQSIATTQIYTSVTNLDLFNKVSIANIRSKVYG